MLWNRSNSNIHLPSSDKRCCANSERSTRQERLRAAFEKMEGWPYRTKDLSFLDDRCSCGSPRASVTIRGWKITACSAMLLGEAEGGPLLHMLPAKPGFAIGCCANSVVLGKQGGQATLRAKCVQRCYCAYSKCSSRSKRSCLLFSGLPTSKNRSFSPSTSKTALVR